MSKFFLGSSSESEEEKDKQEDEEEEVKLPSKYSAKSTEDVEDKRVVKSARDKLYDELDSIVNSLKNSMKINDWNKISSDFERLNKQIGTPKYAEIIRKEGIPKLYIKSLVLLEDFVKTTTENKASLKMNATNGKSFNAMKQKLKKHNKNYEKQIEDFRKTGDQEDDNNNNNNNNNKAKAKEESDSSEEWDPDADSEEDEPITKPKVEEKSKKEKAPVEEGEDEDFPEDEDESDKSEDESDKSDEDKPQDKGAKWFVKTSDKKDGKKDKEKKKRENKVKQPKVKQEEKKEEKKPVTMTPEEVKAKLKEILQSRGKRGTDPFKQIDKLTELLPFAKDPELQIEILIHLVSGQFDVNRSIATHLPITVWKSAHSNLAKIVSLLEQNPSLILHEGEKELAQENEDDDDADESEEMKLVSGNLMAFIQRLDDEFNKSLQAIDPHTQEYLQRLQDENLLLELAEKGQAYYERVGQFKPAARIAARRVEHIYYKLDAHYVRALEAAEKKAEKEAEKKETEKKDDDNNTKVEILPMIPDSLPKVLNQAIISSVDNKELLEKLAASIYTHGDERMKTRTMLCHIYFHAIHDRFYQARDMMLMSHLQESINQTDIHTQILFNRSMVQLGLCAFRNNLIKVAHNCLSEICAAGKVKELLAQGVSTRYSSDKTQEQEKLERKRQLPYHMHINLELLEAIHLITALLLEVPNMAANQYDVKKKIISRPFRRLLDYYDRSVFSGPPENTRDVIITAAKALSRGEWKKCESLLLSLPVWNLVQKSDQVKSMVRRKIQEEGLRTYLFTYASYYDSMSLEQLALMFELQKNTVHSIVSKMMISEELHASWDQPTGAIVMHKVEATRLQYLAMQFADKAANFVENNEKLLESRMGGYSYKPYDQKQQPQKERNWQQDQQRDNKQNTRSKGNVKGGFQTFQTKRQNRYRQQPQQPEEVY